MDSNKNQKIMELMKIVSRGEVLTQRDIAQQMGIAVGMANIYIKRCVAKGWFKVKQTPTKRYAYFMTPAGFKEKARLTQAYLRDSMALYRQVSRHFTDIFTALASSLGANTPVYLVGVSDLTEIAMLWAKQCSVPLHGIIDFSKTSHAELNGLVVHSDLSRCREGAVWVMTVVAHSECDRMKLQSCHPKNVILLEISGV